MKSFLFCTLFLISSLTQAQVRTGGGIIDDRNYNNALPVPEETRSGISQQAKNIREYTSYLKTREKSCRAKDKRYLDIDPGIMEVYLKLSVIKNIFIADNLCSNISEYFKCLQDSTAKKKLKKVLRDKKSTPYLQDQFQISQDDAKKILKFFNEFDQGCAKGNLGCEM